eukprot:s4451_g4.t1
MESPWTAELWSQGEIREFVRMSLACCLDQCMFGLKHPETQDALRKKTRVQTTSREMFQELDQRICDHSHEHSQIAGKCKVHGSNMSLSKYAGFYPKAFAKAIVKGIMRTKSLPIEKPIYHVEDLEDREPSKKRQKTSHDEENTHEPMQVEPSGTPETLAWEATCNMLKSLLPKSGVKTWTNPLHEVFKAVKAVVPTYRIGAIKAGKGLDRFIPGESVWQSEFPMRHTVIMHRQGHAVEDLGNEEWATLSKAKQVRRAKPSHVMLCIFHEGLPKPEIPLMEQPEETTADLPLPPTREAMPREEQIQVDVPAWTPLSATVSGPKFLALSQREQGIIRKLHVNLGHPTADKLARHLAETRALGHLAEGASDYVCPSCAERTSPQKTTPGNLKDPMEFNEKISLDGFEWTSKSGIRAYVLHILDEATRFHLGQRTHRDSQALIKSVNGLWFQWAGAPSSIAHDQAGEFISQEWKDFLQKYGVRPILSAAPWQRGRIERHGSVIEEMLDRIDHDTPITNLEQFDEALRQCFHAKNTMSIVSGFSPEQAVLGRSARLPASIVSDEDTSSHLLHSSQDTASEKFRQQNELRAAARSAFVHADNSDAIRRALNRQSRGVSHSWACGQLCMYWDRRKSPNMLEKGRWNGPAQIVCQESRTIYWVNHMNRLLRCARENLRPVSLREFQQHSTFSQTSSPEQLQRMANRLQERLKERNGMFQYSDLTQVEPDENQAEEPQQPTPSNASQMSKQPEEEPIRRTSLKLHSDAEQFALARDTPVPESPTALTPPESAAAPAPSLGDASPDTASLDTDQEESPNNMEPVYNVSLVENGVDNDVYVEDDEALWTAEDCQEQICASFAFDVPKQQLSRFLARPEEHLPCLVAAAKKSRNEVVYSDLTKEEQTLFQAAKNKELKCWLDTNTVKAIVKDRIHPDQILSSRWILTWKEDQTSPSGRKAKARLVVKGFQDPDIGILNSDSPTLTRDARMLLLQTVSSKRWTVQSFDITTAFLRGRSDERELAMEPPSELRSLMGIDKSHVCLLQGNAYGRVDAPLLFYREFRKRLEEVGFEAHPLDSCLFLLRNKHHPDQLDGILGTHVDDGIGGGNQNFERALEQLQKTLPFGTREYQKFKFTGLDIEQLPDHSIRVNQGKYVHKISPIDVPKNRRNAPESPVTAQELQQLRGLCGSVQYAAVHSRPDIATKVASLQKGITTATVETLLEANKVLKEAQAHADTSVIVRPLPMAEVCFASFGDASFASAKQLSAQQGHICR